MLCCVLWMVLHKLHIVPSHLIISKFYCKFTWENIYVPLVGSCNHMQLPSMWHFNKPLNWIIDTLMGKQTAVLNVTCCLAIDNNIVISLSCINNDFHLWFMSFNDLNFKCSIAIFHFNKIQSYKLVIQTCKSVRH